MLGGEREGGVGVGGVGVLMGRRGRPSLLGRGRKRASTTSVGVRSAGESRSFA